MNKVCFLGSINMDMVIKVDSMPKVGETILCNDMEKIPGGKGANQAIAAKRSGADVFMIGKVGKDENGSILVKKLEEDKVNAENVLKDDSKSTGMAIITVNAKGNNSIIVIPGSNMEIRKSQIEKSQNTIKKCDILVTQLETPMDSAVEAFKLARKYNRLTVLNPSPSKILDKELIENTDIIVPNETEICDITGIVVTDIFSAKKAAQFFIDKGVKAVIITLGENGVALVTKDNAEVIPAYKVDVVDTTAAGDSFLGALVSKINMQNINFEGLKEAVQFGNKVASITVQRKGAQPSIPYLKDVNEIYIKG
ncbi:ribokinase [Clostridium akagii]|uniref:ribokinase n=1 Tax=Clostridium akagii TaxID=91623 RepID=UPI00047974BF|nr:ribokinase [Clostridium akagii]